MRILIIGAKGQLGSDCCRVLGEENDTAGCDIPLIDITDRESIARTFREKRPQVVVNCAAYTAVDNCETDRELAWKVNATGPGLLAEACRKHSARLIHISTDYVFDGKKLPPKSYSEDEPTNPLSEYGKSKLEGEQAVLAQTEDAIILRTAWLYSGWGKNFLKTILRLVLQDSERELKVVNDQYGSLTWSYTLARQIKHLLDSDIRGIVHTTSEGYSTWYEAARYFLDRMDVPYRMRPCSTAEYPTPAHRPANSILENSVLKKAGLSLFVDWKEDLDRFVEIFRDDLLAEARGDTA